MDEAILKNKVGQEQIHGLLFSNQISWQSIIYDLINTEQLDPWDIDIAPLANKYLERVRELEEANLFVSSKVLFAASLLLRIKAEILLEHFIPSLDEILFGREEKKKYTQERLELDEEVPELYPRTPLPRFRKVSLEELMSALSKAFVTENRRIKKIILIKQQELETGIALPKKRINMQEKTKEVYEKLKKFFELKNDKIAFSELSGQDAKGKVETFIPLLYLDNQHKIFLEQEKHFGEIWIWLKHIYEEKNKDELEKLRKEVEDFLESAEYQQMLEEEEEKHEGKLTKTGRGKKKKGKMKANTGQEKSNEKTDAFTNPAQTSIKKADIDEE